MNISLKKKNPKQTDKYNFYKWRQRFIENVPIGYFMLTLLILTLAVLSLSKHSIISICTNPVKFERNRMVRITQNFEPFWQKWLITLNKVLTPFDSINCKRPSSSWQKITPVKHVQWRYNKYGRPNQSSKNKQTNNMKKNATKRPDVFKIDRQF